MAVLDKAVEVVPGADLVLIFTRYTGQQVLTLVGGATGGTLPFTYRGQSTGQLAYNVTGAGLQAALEALSTIGVGNVAVSGAAGGPWTATPQNQLSPDDFKKNPITATYTNLTGGSNYHLNVSFPTLDISTGYAYALQARDVSGETTPDLIIDATHPTQGAIDLTNGTVGEVKVTVYHSATALFDFSTPPANGYANFVLMEIQSSLYTPIVEGQLHLKGKYFI